MSCGASCGTHPRYDYTSSATAKLWGDRSFTMSVLTAIRYASTYGYISAYADGSTASGYGGQDSVTIATLKAKSCVSLSICRDQHTDARVDNGSQLSTTRPRPSQQTLAMASSAWAFNPSPPSMLLRTLIRHVLLYTRSYHHLMISWAVDRAKDGQISALFVQNSQQRRRTLPRWHKPSKVSATSCFA